jgi:hypothetical protein
VRGYDRRKAIFAIQPVDVPASITAPPRPGEGVLHLVYESAIDFRKSLSSDDSDPPKIWKGQLKNVEK